MRTLSYPLSCGTLGLTIDYEHKPFESLVSVGERINPKRPFIFLSKVIGRYIPTSLETMFDTASDLVSLIPPNLLDDQKTTLISLSETALGLGTLAHFILKEQGHHILNSMTSRHCLNLPIFSTFTEPHSHLPDHFLYKSFDDQITQHLFDSETLILVDDEITTGNTLKNLFRSLKLTKVKRVILLTLTDWSGTSTDDWGTDIEVHKFSLIRGTYTWTYNLVATPNSLPYTPSTMDLFDIPLYSLRVPSFDGLTFDVSRYAQSIKKEHKELSLVLYTNELLPDSLQLMLQSRMTYTKVYFLSLSSSPILVGGGIQSIKTFPGLYTDTPLYLYNLDEALQEYSSTHSVKITLFIDKQLPNRKVFIEEVKKLITRRVRVEHPSIVNSNSALDCEFF